MEKESYEHMYWEGDDLHVIGDKGHTIYRDAKMIEQKVAKDPIQANAILMQCTVTFGEVEELDKGVLFHG